MCPDVARCPLVARSAFLSPTPTLRATGHTAGLPYPTATVRIKRHVGKPQASFLVFFLARRHVLGSQGKRDGCFNENI